MGLFVHKNRPRLLEKLDIVFWNVEGIWSKVQDNECLSFFKENDFVFLCEVWCDKVPEIPGYFSFYKLKKKASVKGRIPGGLIIYLKEKFKNDVEIIGNTMEEVIWIKLKSEKCLFAIVYRHPDKSKFSIQFFFKLLITN